jgi:hypothetical protein
LYNKKEIKMEISKKFNNYFFIINDKEEVVIIDEVEQSFNRRRSNSWNERDYEISFNRESEASKIFFEELQDSKYVKIPATSKDGKEFFITINSNISIEDYYKFLRNYENNYEECTLGELRFYEENKNIRNALRLLITARTEYDRDFRIKLIEEYVKDADMSLPREIRRLIDKETRDIIKEVELIQKDNFFFLNDVKPRLLGKKIDLTLIKKVLEKIHNFENRSLVHKAIEDLWSFKDINQYILLEDPEWFARMVEKNEYFYPESINLLSLIKEMSNEKLEKIFNIAVTKEKENAITNYYSFVPLFLEYFRRDLHVGKNISSDLLMGQLKMIRTSLVSFPFTYTEVITKIFREIISNSKTNMVNYIAYEIIIFMSSGFVKAEAQDVLDVVFKDNFNLLKEKHMVNGSMSYEYFSYLFKIKLDNSYTKLNSKLFEKDYKQLTTQSFDSNANRVVAMLMYFEENNLSQQLRTEILQEGFAAIHKSIKGEKMRFIRVISLVIHHNDFKKDKDYITDEMVVQFLTEMMKSNLKNNIIERIIDLPNYKNYNDEYYAQRRTSNKLLFGMDYAEATNLIQKVDFRGKVEAILVKLMLG